MEAKEGHGGSYVWKSILKGRGVIGQGVKWRVGNEESIKLWGDNWPTSLQILRIQGPLMAELQNAYVSSLINPSTRQWDLTLLPNVFSHEEAELIKKIPISRINSADALFWPFVQSGQYTTKSWYFFLKNEARTTIPLNHNHAEMLKPL